MKKHLKFLSILPILLTLCSCDNKKQYDYSRYYSKNNDEGWVYLFCWKEWFQWNTCILGVYSIGYVKAERIIECQYNYPCPIEVMKEIIKKNKKVAPKLRYLICIVDKPAIDDTYIYYTITEFNYNEFMYLYNFLEIEPMDFAFFE